MHKGLDDLDSIPSLKIENIFPDSNSKIAEKLFSPPLNFCLSIMSFPAQEQTESLSLGQMVKKDVTPGARRSSLMLQNFLWDWLFMGFYPQVGMLR